MGRARDHLGKVTVFYAVLKRQICSLDSSFKNATVSLVYLHFLLYCLHCSKSEADVHLCHWIYLTCIGSFNAHRLTKSDKPDIISAIKGTPARPEAQIYQI